MSIKILPLLLIPSLSFAANLSNQLNGVGTGKAEVKPYVCIQDKDGQVQLSLAPGAVGDANQAAKSGAYVGATLRFGGCGSNNSYLGYLNLNLDGSDANAVSTYVKPDDSIDFTNYHIGSDGTFTGKITFKAIDDNSDITPAHNNTTWQFAGVNLAGLEFGSMLSPSVIPDLSAKNAQKSTSDLNDTQTFIQQGINTIRLPLSWSYLQNEGAGVGEINTQDYYNSYVRPALRSLTQAKVNTIVDLHTYMRYPKFGEQYSGCGGGACPDGTLITDENVYKDIWLKLYTLIKQDPQINQQYILLDLVNEPVDVPDDKVFTIQASVIKALRSAGFEGYILVEGNSWSGLHSWLSYQWSGSDGKTYTNASLFSRENFARAGINDLSKIIINVHQYLDSNYSGTSNDCQQNIWTEGDNGFNLNAFVNYLQQNQLKAMVTEFGAGQNASSCSAPLHDFMQYLQDNSAQNKEYGFAGWTIWSSGHGWGTYNLRVTPQSFQWDVLKAFL